MRSTLVPVRPSRRLFGAAAACAALLVACGDDSSSSSATTPSAADLAGRTFLSTAVSGQTLIDGTQVSIAFTDATLAALAGCNTMTGGYTISGSALAAPALAQTLMACDEPATEQDAWVAGILTGGPTITLDGSVLTLKKGDLTLTLGDRDTVANDHALDGGSWALDTIDGDGVSLTAPERAFMAVSDGQLYVATGCNRAFGDVTVNANGTAEIGVLASTRMMCEGPIAEWEQALLAFLQGSVTWEVDGTDVTLSNGTQTLVMHEVPWTP